jgi:glycosyltransferase involved in cell wall biosynthesis
MRGHASRNIVAAIDEEPGMRSYDGGVRLIVNQFDRDSYISAANALNTMDVDVASLQHEYGIFGGDWGEYVLDFCRNLRVPLITTFHTVHTGLPAKAREIQIEITELSEAVIVTIESAARLLEKRLGIDPRKIRVIHHGASSPDRPRGASAKRVLGLQRRTVLATFGLINPAKGIEYAIEALSHLVRDHPDLLYLIIGRTHPEVRKREGEAYRQKLTSIVRRLGLDRNVRFVDKFLQDDELSQYLQAVDAYVAPYLGKEQVSSGTLTLALAHGRAVVSTPTKFAREVLSGNRGLFCRFADALSLAKSIRRILEDKALRKQLETNAFKYGRDVGWTRVADQYGDVLRSAARTGRAVTEAKAISEA